MKRRTKIGVGAGLVTLVAAITVVSVAARDRGATAVRVETVSRKDLVATVTASGWIRPRRAVEIQADIMGRITDLPIEEGDRVKKGQLLLRIDRTRYEAAVSQARAMVSSALAQEAQARASLIQAERTLERARAVSATGSNLMSPQALEEAETQARVQEALLEAAQHGVSRARAALDEARDQLDKTVIRSPIDGIVTRLNVEEGEMAIVGTMNNPGSLLLTISDLSVMEAVIRVDETDVPELQLGDSAAVEIDAFPKQKFSGRVTQVGHSAVVPPSRSSSLGGGQSQQAVDFEVVITLDNPPPTLRPDLSANADVVTATKKGSLVIPIIALTVREKEKEGEALPNESQEARAAAEARREDTDEEGVFVVREGKAKFVPVKVGIAGQEHFEVTSGLAEGDSVAAGPYEAIRALEDDKPVRVLREEKKDKKKGGDKKEGSA